MPIVFAPPDPVGAQAHAAAGYNAAGGGGQGGYAAIMARQTGDALDRALGAAQIEQRDRIATSGQAQEDIQFAHANQLRSQLAQMDREVSPQQVFAANADLVRQQQHAELAVWANNQEMTQAEMLQLQRQKAAVSEINNRADWTPEEKADAVTLLRTKIDRGDMRAKATHEKAMQANIAKDQAQTKILLEKEKAVAKARTQTLSDQVQWQIDPNRQAELEDMLGPEPHPGAAGVMGAVAQVADRAKRLQVLAGKMGALIPHEQDPETGKWTPNFKYQSPQHQQLETQQKMQEHALKLFQQESDHYAKHYQTAQKRVEALMTEGTGKKPWELRREDIDAEVQKDLANQGIKPPSLAQFGTRPGQQQQQPPAQPKPAKPFDLNGDSKEWSEPQRFQVETWRKVLSLATQGAGVDDGRRVEFQRDAAVAVSLLAKYGSPADMPPEVKQQYDGIKQRFAQVQLPSTPRPLLGSVNRPMPGGTGMNSGPRR